MAHRNADSVLPEPVGATTKAFAPEAIADQAPICAGVGSGKAEVNQACVGSLNRASTSSPEGRSAVRDRLAT